MLSIHTYNDQIPALIDKMIDSVETRHHGFADASFALTGRVPGVRAVKSVHDGVASAAYGRAHDVNHLVADYVKLYDSLEHMDLDLDLEEFRLEL